MSIQTEAEYAAQIAEEINNGDVEIWIHRRDGTAEPLSISHHAMLLAGLRKLIQEEPQIDPATLTAPSIEAFEQNRAFIEGFLKGVSRGDKHE